MYRSLQVHRRQDGGFCARPPSGGVWVKARYKSTQNSSTEGVSSTVGSGDFSLKSQIADIVSLSGQEEKLSMSYGYLYNHVT